MSWQLAGVELVECTEVIWLRPRPTALIVDDAEAGEQAGRWRTRINTNCVDGDCSARVGAGTAGRDK